MALSSYLKYYWKAKTKYRVHSPFVFDFIENVLEDKRQYYYFGAIEHYRAELLANSTKLALSSSTTLIKDIAKHNGVSRKIGSLLFKTIHHYQPKNAIEFGTSLGLATLYQCTPSKAITFYTLEKDAAIAKFTQSNFDKLGITQAMITIGDFDQNLATILKAIPQIDYVLFNEVVPILMRETLLQKAATDAMFVLNKPYENEEKMAFWEWLKNNTSITLTIDLYDIGLAFIREEQKQKTHFDLIKVAKKPWAIF